MDPSYLKALLVVCPFVFLAAFVDAIAGGGGLISLPAYLAAGLPIHVAYGTNKLTSCCGITFSTLKYARSGYIRWRPALVAGVGALIGSAMGVRLVLILSEETLRWALVFILPVVAVFLLFNRGFGKEQKPRELSPGVLYLLVFLIGLVIGAYDGFFGPGTGTFLVIAFTAVVGWNLTTATGNTKVVNFCSNFSALIGYIISGNVNFAVGLPAALCGILGSWLGASMAVKKGASFIRPVVIFAVGLLFINIIKDMF